MKKILVPVDFSECATYAADLAVSLAEKLNAEVHFLTSLQSTPLWAKIGENLLSDYTESYKRQKEAAENLQVLRSRYADRHVPISLSFSTKALLDLIPRYVDKEDITMIVMGSAGAAGLKEWMVGSHTQKVVRLSSVPVLVIKHPLNSVALRNVAFASDFKADAKDAFRQAVEFVTPFGPHMHLVHIHSAETGDKAGDIDAFARMCWQLPVSRHDIQDLGIELGISHFVADKVIDLLIISHKGMDKDKRTGLADALVNHVEYPVLTINTQPQYDWIKIEEVKA